MISKLLIYAFAIFLLGLLVAYRVGYLANQKQLREPGPIDVEFTLNESSKISDSFQIIKGPDFKVFSDIYPRYVIGDILKVSGEVNVNGLVFRPKIEKVGRKESFLGHLSDLRLEISSRINGLIPLREATLLNGMVLGVDEIDPNFREQLISTGTIHVVVVSGQNLSLVAGFFMIFVKYLGRRFAMFLSILAVVFYALLTGFEVPVVRAMIMVILASMAVYLGRERLVIWNLFLAAIIIILIWPEAILDVSFQLTFAATFGIMTLGQKLNRITNYKNQIAKLIAGNAAVATSAYLFTTPVIFFHFERISLISPLVNVLVAEAVVPIMVIGFMVAIATLVFMPIAQLLAFLAYVPAFYFVKVIEIFS